MATINCKMIEEQQHKNCHTEMEEEQKQLQHSNHNHHLEQALQTSTKTQQCAITTSGSTSSIALDDKMDSTERSSSLSRSSFSDISSDIGSGTMTTRMTIMEQSETTDGHPIDQPKEQIKLKESNKEKKINDTSKDNPINEDMFENVFEATMDDLELNVGADGYETDTESSENGDNQNYHQTEKENINRNNLHIHQTQNHSIINGKPLSKNKCKLSQLQSLDYALMMCNEEMRADSQSSGDSSDNEDVTSENGESDAEEDDDDEEEEEENVSGLLSSNMIGGMGLKGPLVSGGGNAIGKLSLGVSPKYSAMGIFQMRPYLLPFAERRRLSQCKEEEDEDDGEKIVPQPKIPEIIINEVAPITAAAIATTTTATQSTPTQQSTEQSLTTEATTTITTATTTAVAAITTNTETEGGKVSGVGGSDGGVMQSVLQSAATTAATRDKFRDLERLRQQFMQKIDNINASNIQEIKSVNMPPEVVVPPPPPPIPPTILPPALINLLESAKAKTAKLTFGKTKATTPPKSKMTAPTTINDTEETSTLNTSINGDDAIQSEKSVDAGVPFQAPTSLFTSKVSPESKVIRGKFVVTKTPEITIESTDYPKQLRSEAQQLEYFGSNSNAHTISFPSKFGGYSSVHGLFSQRYGSKSDPRNRPHLSKKFFDTSLVEIRNVADRNDGKGGGKGGGVVCDVITNHRENDLRVTSSLGSVECNNFNKSPTVHQQPQFARQQQYLSNCDISVDQGSEDETASSKVPLNQRLDEVWIKRDNDQMNLMKPKTTHFPYFVPFEEVS